jgi:hypothetical protein
MGSHFGRKLAKRKLNVSRESLERLAGAAQALSNLDQVKQLNDLLAAVREITPHLEETRTLCAMLIQDKLDMERKNECREYAIRKVLEEIPLGGGGQNAFEVYGRACERWELENPEEPVRAHLEATAGSPGDLHGERL